MLVERRLATEANALLKAVIDAVEIAVFTFDEKGKLRLMNPAGAVLLMRRQEHVLGHDAVELGLDDCLAGDPVRLIDRDFPGRSGTRWGLRRTTFREGGRPHQLLVLTDLGRALREEERIAWQRLIRVLGHEINNSLAPIQSIAESLSDLLTQTEETRPRSWEKDLQGGMAIIRDRASALGRFMTAYARLARLPPPILRPVELGSIIRQVAALETRLTVKTTSTEKAVANIDRDQIEQLLINLVKNAVDASLEKGHDVEIGWGRSQTEWLVQVIDEGSGIANPTNLFVPFFTTKSSGSGIGLVLCRQIAEAHGGSLTLENRTDGIVGCIAELRPCCGVTVPRAISAIGRCASGSFTGATEIRPDERGPARANWEPLLRRETVSRGHRLLSAFPEIPAGKCFRPNRPRHGILVQRQPR